MELGVSWGEFVVIVLFKKKKKKTLQKRKKTLSPNLFTNELTKGHKDNQWFAKVTQQSRA